MEYTASEMLNEALMEVRMRRAVYEGRIEQGNMTRAEADRKIAIMMQIAELLDKLAAKERLL